MKEINCNHKFLAGIFFSRFFFVAFNNILLLKKNPPPWPYQDEMLKAAYKIQNKLPKQAVIGSWNAGIIGYFSDRIVVNLDGLVNSDIREIVTKHNKKLSQYIIDKDIQYISDYNLMFIDDIQGKLINKDWVKSNLTPIINIPTKKNSWGKQYGYTVYKVKKVVKEKKGTKK